MSDRANLGVSYPVLVATAVDYCVTHAATDHNDGRAWADCRFRQLFYFENAADEHSLLWSDEMAEPARVTSIETPTQEEDA